MSKALPILTHIVSPSMGLVQKIKRDKKEKKRENRKRRRQSLVEDLAGKVGEAQRLQRGAGGTILTGASGVLGDSTAGKRTLLGGA